MGTWIHRFNLSRQKGCHGNLNFKRIDPWMGSRVFVGDVWYSLWAHNTSKAWFLRWWAFFSRAHRRYRYTTHFGSNHINQTTYNDYLFRPRSKWARYPLQSHVGVFSIASFAIEEQYWTITQGDLGLSERLVPFSCIWCKHYGTSNVRRLHGDASSLYGVFCYPTRC